MWTSIFSKAVLGIALTAASFWSNFLPGKGVPSANPTQIVNQTIYPAPNTSTYTLYNYSSNSNSMNQYTFPAIQSSNYAANLPASPGSGQQTLSSVVALIIAYLNQALVLLMAFAIVMFVWYVIKYFIKADADRTEAGKYVMYAVIGFFVILSVWGIVNILINTFGFSNSASQYQSWSAFTNIFPK